MPFGFHPDIPDYYYPDYPYTMQGQYPQYPYMNNYYPVNRGNGRRDDIYNDYYYAQRPPYYREPYWGSMPPYPPGPVYNQSPSSAQKLLSYVGPFMDLLNVVGPRLLGIKSLFPF